MSMPQEAGWIAEQFEGALLGDVRRVRRASQIATQMAEAPGESIPALFERRYDVKAAYALFSHPSATPDRLQEGHRRRLREGMASGRTILLLEDTSTFSWSGNLPRLGLGPIGHGSEGLQGFDVHSVLALAWPEDQEPETGRSRPAVRILGVADPQ